MNNHRPPARPLQICTSKVADEKLTIYFDWPVLLGKWIKRTRTDTDSDTYTDSDADSDIVRKGSSPQLPLTVSAEDQYKSVNYKEAQVRG